MVTKFSRKIRAQFKAVYYVKQDLIGVQYWRTQDIGFTDVFLCYFIHLTGFDIHLLQV